MDLRVERTYRSLVNEFIRLLEEKDFEEISVAELCEGAMIRRTTFYKHFADKNEFLTFFVKELRDEFAKQVENSKEASGDAIENCLSMLHQTMEFLTEHGRLVDNALAGQSALMLIDALGDVIHADMLKELTRQTQADDTGTGITSSPAVASDRITELSPPPRYEYDTETLATFVSGGIVKMLRTWCEAGRPPEMEQHMDAMVLAVRQLLPRS